MSNDLGFLIPNCSFLIPNFFFSRADLNAPNAKNKRYAAPKIFSRSIAVAEDFISVATPNITSVVWKTIPLTKPHAKIIPAFAPSDKLFVSKYKMSGPGASVNSIDAAKKYKNVESSNQITSRRLYHTLTSAAREV